MCIILLQFKSVICFQINDLFYCIVELKQNISKYIELNQIKLN